MGKRVLVTGGRWFNLPDVVHVALSPIQALFGVDELAEGGATGADELSKLWALSQGIPVATYDANWKTFGNRAGTMRNARMLRDFRPDLAVAFPGGPGTRDMIERLVEAGIPILIGTYTDSTETMVRWRRNG